MTHHDLRAVRGLVAGLAAIALTACNRAATDGSPSGAASAPSAPTAQAGPPSAAPAATSAPATGDAPYRVVDGYKVDAVTLKGFRTWRAAACDRCHGPNQEGLVGPSLVASLKVLTKAEFVTTVTQGRLEKGMPSFGGNATVTESIDALYAYLKGRSDGAITRAKVEAL